LAARHLATAQRHAHALRDAIRYGDKRAIEKLIKLRDQAYARHAIARGKTLFPWEQ
jgi:hypothetical protein